jgi:hypothetical protein
LDDCAVEIGMCVARREVGGGEDVEKAKEEGMGGIGIEGGVCEIPGHVADGDCELVERMGRAVLRVNAKREKRGRKRSMDDLKKFGRLSNGSQTANGDREKKNRFGDV